MERWAQIEAESQPISEELFDCLKLLWGDALHLFQNLQIDTTSSRFSKNWKSRLSQAISDKNRTKLSQFTYQHELISPRKENETFQDFERDFQDHLTQFKIEMSFLNFEPRSVKPEQEARFLEDVRAMPENTSIFCLLHALKNVTPFRSSFEAQNVLDKYSQEMSRMVSRIFSFRYCSFLITNVMKEWVGRYHPSKTLLYKVSMVSEELKILKNTVMLQQKALDAVENVICRSRQPTNAAATGTESSIQTNQRASTVAKTTWLKNQKLFEDVEQLEKKGGILALQVGRASRQNRSPACNL